MKTKICAACKEEKDLSEFWKNKARKDGLCSSCKNCVNSQAFSPKRIANRKVYNKVNKTRVKNYQLCRKFNITIEQYDQMLKDQDSKCAICQCTKDRFNRDFAVDHNHVTGQIRGLLCGPCNTSIGVFQVDTGIEMIQRALEYSKTKI